MLWCVACKLLKVLDEVGLVEEIVLVDDFGQRFGVLQMVKKWYMPGTYFVSLY